MFSPFYRALSSIPAFPRALFVCLLWLTSCHESLEKAPLASPSPHAYRPAAADFQNSVYDDTLTGTTAHRHSALARVEHHFPAGLPAYVDIRLHSTVLGNTYPGSQVGIAVFVDDQFVSIANPTRLREDEVVRINLPASPGEHNVALVESLQEEIRPGYYAGTFLVAADYGPTAVFRVAPPASSQTIFEDTDSIGLGVGTTIAQRDGVQAQLAKYLPTTVFVSLGAGRRQISTSYETAAKRQAMTKRIVRYAADSRRLLYFFALGINDTGQAHSAITTAGFAGHYLDELHAALPAMRIIMQTPLLTVRTDNYREQNAQLIRAALVAMAASRPWLTVIDGRKLLDNSHELADGMHPNNKGAAKYASRLYSVLFSSAPK